MVQGIESGVVALNEKSLKRLNTSELQLLALELDRQLRLKRSEQPALDDIAAIQDRQRTIQKLTASLMMLRGHQQRRK